MLFKEIEPTSGTLLLNDTDVTNLKKTQSLFFRIKIGVIFEDFRLIPTLNIYGYSCKRYCRHNKKKTNRHSKWNDNKR